MKSTLTLVSIMLAQSALAQVRTIGPFANPGAIHLSDDTLYIANNEGEPDERITLYDISQPGAEVEIDVLDAPGDPQDLLTLNDNLITIDEYRSYLYRLDMSATSRASWQKIPVRNPPEWDYGFGNVFFYDEGRIYVLYTAENIISVVDSETMQVTDTITDLDHNPTYMSFSDEHVIVLNSSMDGACGTEGPNIAVFEKESLKKLKRIDIGNACTSTIAYKDGQLYVDFFKRYEAGIRTFDIDSGRETAKLRFKSKVGRHFLLAKEGLVYHRGKNVGMVDYKLRKTCWEHTVIKNPQTWYPALEAMAASDDGRLFVTNRNDDTVTIIDNFDSCE